MRYKLLIIILLFIPNLALADGYHWVRSSGTQTTWGSCRTATDTPPADDNANYCTFKTAWTNPVAGDIVYYRGGTYTLVAAGSNDTAIKPSNSGTSAVAKIIFSAYGSEVPVFTGTEVGMVGINISGKSWIKIIGFTFQDLGGLSFISGDAHHNEISYCKFTNDTNYMVGSRMFVISSSGSPPYSTHNWFHHNYLSKRGNLSACTEGIDIMRVGMAGHGDKSDFNTIEYNYLEYSAHANLVVYGHYNVIRGNIGHNEPWMTGCEVYNGGDVDNYGDTRGATSTDEKTIGTGNNISFTILAGLNSTYNPGGTDRWVAGQPVSIVSAANWDNVMFGEIVSYNDGTGALVINITKTGGSGTYSDWFISTKTVPYYTNTGYNLKYAHRVFCMEAEDNDIPQYNIVEGNRFGFAGHNPNNAGGNNLDIGTARNIVRYNLVYGAMGAGMGEKQSPSSSTNTANDNRIYNNTGYYNGYGFDATLYGALNTTYSGQGFYQYDKGGADPQNILKNNLFYNNRTGDICNYNSIAGCSAEAFDTVTNNLIGTDPGFTNPDMTDPTSQNIFSDVHGYIATPIPNLRLNLGSAAINGGTYLTQANGAGTTSTTLIVDDALYFQDGRRGASIAGHTADWIAVGTVGNTVQISQVYQTLTLGTAPGGSGWSIGETITGAGGGVNVSATGVTCVVVSVESTTSYTVKDCTGTYDFGETLTNGVDTAAQSSTNTETMLISPAPGGAGWSVGETITGVTSGITSVITAKASTTSYTIRSRTGPYTLGEILTNGTDTADQASSYPHISALVVKPDLSYSNTMLLASAITWADNAPVWLYKKSDGVQVLYGSAPDYGAHEFYGGTTTISGTGTITLGGSGTITITP